MALLTAVPSVVGLAALGQQCLLVVGVHASQQGLGFLFKAVQFIAGD